MEDLTRGDLGDMFHPNAGNHLDWKSLIRVVNMVHYTDERNMNVNGC